MARIDIIPDQPGPYDCLADANFLTHLPSLIRKLKHIVKDVAEGTEHWIFYGSRVLGTAGEDSDIDVIVAHEGTGVPQRIGTVVESVPVTIYCVPWRELLCDGQRRKFGGYFALKLFSPFVCRPAGLDEKLAEIVAGFLAPLAATTAPVNTDRSQDQILADSYLVFLRLYPGFEGYTAAGFRHSLAPQLWRRQAEVLVDAFQTCGFLQRTGCNKYRYTRQAHLDDVTLTTSLSAARFWAFGAVCHGSDFTFPDQYHRKALSKTSVADRRIAYRWLDSIARGTKP